MYYRGNVSACLDFSTPSRSASPAHDVGGVQAPWLILALTASLVLIYAAEQRFAIGPAASPMTVSVQTLVAAGGLNRGHILATHEWYRLLTGPFLHAGVMHLLLNGLVLLLIGPSLERLIGRRWLAATYLASALGGALASFAFQPSNVTSVGASGAIMGLLAAGFIVSYRLPKGSPTRRRMEWRALIYLLPSLLPLGAHAGGMQTDYFAHFGGGFTGCLMGFLALGFWPRDSRHPELRRFVAGIILAGVLVAACGATAVALNDPRDQRHAALIPAGQLPSAYADSIAAAPRLLAQYPDDPRAHAFAAYALLDRQARQRPDRTDGPAIDAALRELRSAITLAEHGDSIMPPAFSNGLRVVLAALLANRGDIAPARTALRPACQSPDTASLDPWLRQQMLDLHLCD